MIDFEINIADKVGDLPAYGARYIKAGIKLIAEHLRNEMQVQSPVRTGNLRRKIRKPQMISDYEQGIAIEAPYWKDVQFGTRPHEIRPVRAKALRFKWHGKYVYFKRVQHPGTKPNPFITRAQNNIRARMDFILAELSGGTTSSRSGGVVYG